MSASKIDLDQWIASINKCGFNLIDSTNPASLGFFGNSDKSSSTETLPKVKPKKYSQRISKNQEKEENAEERSSSKSGKGKRGGKSKQKKASARLRKTNLLEVFEQSTKTSDEITQDILHPVEGFDFNIGQNICDDSKPTLGEEASSYFMMRHCFAYPGPVAMMMQPMGYRLSAEAVHREKLVLVGNYQENTVEGMLEWTPNPNLKAHATVIAGFMSKQQEQMQAMMGGGMKMPSGMGFIDFKHDNWATRLNVDAISNQLTLSFNRRMTENLSTGLRMSTSYDARKTAFDFGGKYKWKHDLFSTSVKSADSAVKESSSSLSGTMGVKKAGLHVLEACYSMTSGFADVKFSHYVTDQCALTSTLKWKPFTDQALATLGYKFQFGKNMMSAKTIVGEIASDGNVKQSITFPLLGNMMCKFYAEMNHWIPPQAMQQGHFPHKFGFQLTAHL